jgi:hypothetical protein
MMAGDISTYTLAIRSPQLSNYMGEWSIIMNEYEAGCSNKVIYLRSKNHKLSSSRIAGRDP